LRGALGVAIPRSRSGRSNGGRCNRRGVRDRGVSLRAEVLGKILDEGYRLFPAANGAAINHQFYCLVPAADDLCVLRHLCQTVQFLGKFVAIGLTVASGNST